MSESRLFSVKMRASRGGEHVSGAERIVTPSATPETASALVRRALGHSKGDPDFISLKVAAIGDVKRIKALPVATETAATPDEGLAIAERLLREAGVERTDPYTVLCGRHPCVTRTLPSPDRDRRRY